MSWIRICICSCSVVSRGCAGCKECVFCLLVMQGLISGEETVRPPLPAYGSSCILISDCPQPRQKQDSPESKDREVVWNRDICPLGSLLTERQSEGGVERRGRMKGCGVDGAMRKDREKNRSIDWKGEWWRGRRRMSGVKQGTRHSCQYLQWYLDSPSGSSRSAVHCHVLCQASTHTFLFVQ